MLSLLGTTGERRLQVVRVIGGRPQRKRPASANYGEAGIELRTKRQQVIFVAAPPVKQEQPGYGGGPWEAREGLVKQRYFLRKFANLIRTKKGGDPCDRRLSIVFTVYRWTRNLTASTVSVGSASSGPWPPRSRVTP